MGPPGQKFEGVFKVQLNKKDCSEIGEKIAVQRFRIDSDRHVLLQTLNEKIYNGFKELQEPDKTFEVFWKDSDDESIRISDNDGLLDALNEMGGIVFSIYAVMHGGNESTKSFGSNVSINTLKAETIESKYIPPTIDEEKIMESLKDKNRTIMKQISRVDLEYDDMILFSKHFGPLYQKLKGGIFGKETKLEVVACRGRIVFYDNEKSLFNSIATPKESRDRIEIIADKDQEKFEFTILEEKYKFRVPEKDERSMWINAIDMSLNCKCKRDDLICKSKSCYVVQDDDEEWDTIDDNIEIVDWEKRWASKLRLIPCLMDPSYEYYPDFGSSSTISVEVDNDPPKPMAKEEVIPHENESSDEDVYVDFGNDPESEHSSEDVYDDPIEEQSDDSEDVYASPSDDSEGEEDTNGSEEDSDINDKTDGNDICIKSKNQMKTRQTSVSQISANFDVAEQADPTEPLRDGTSKQILDQPDNYIKTNDSDAPMKRQSIKNRGKNLNANTLDSKTSKESADKVLDIKNDTGNNVVSPNHASKWKKPVKEKVARDKQEEANQDLENKSEVSLKPLTLKISDENEKVKTPKYRGDGHVTLTKSNISKHHSNDEIDDAVKRQKNIRAFHQKCPSWKEPEKEKRVEIVKADANEHGVPLKPTNLKNFFDKLEAKANDEDPAAIRAKLKPQKQSTGAEVSKTRSNASKDANIPTKEFKETVPIPAGPKKIVIPKAFS